MKKNKGIIITGGSFNAKKMNISQNEPTTGGNKSGYSKPHVEKNKADDVAMNAARALLAKGKLQDSLEFLRNYFEGSRRTTAANSIIVQLSVLSQLRVRERTGVITQEQGQVERTKISNAVLQIIDELIGH